MSLPKLFWNAEGWKWIQYTVFVGIQDAGRKDVEQIGHVMFLFASKMCSTLYTTLPGKMEEVESYERNSK